MPQLVEVTEYRYVIAENDCDRYYRPSHTLTWGDLAVEFQVLLAAHEACIKSLEPP